MIDNNNLKLTYKNVVKSFDDVGLFMDNETRLSFKIYDNQILSFVYLKLY